MLPVDAIQFAYDNFFSATSKGRAEERSGASPRQIIAHCLSSDWPLLLSEEESIVKRIVGTRRDKPRDLMSVCFKVAGFERAPDLLNKDSDLDQTEIAALAEAIDIVRLAGRNDQEAKRRLTAHGIRRTMSKPRGARLGTYNALFISEAHSIVVANFDFGLDPGNNRIEQRATAGSTAYRDFICGIALAEREDPFILIEFGQETVRPDDLQLNLGGPIMTISGAVPEQIDARQIKRAAAIADGHDPRRIQDFLRLIEDRKTDPDGASAIDRKIEQLLKTSPFDDAALEETRLKPSGRAFSLFRHLITPATAEDTEATSS